MSVRSGARGGMIPRFGFVTCGSFSGTNDAILPLLCERFGGLEADVVDIPTWVRDQPAILGANLARVVVRRPALLTNRASLWGAFMRSSYLSEAIRSSMRDRMQGRGYAFSIQTQSLFDASVPDLPHFVYTDHTQLANLYYPETDGEAVPHSQRAHHEKWIEREHSIYHRAQIVFTMSSHVSRSLVEHYGLPAAKAQCVFAGANVAPTGASQPRAPDGQRILFVGRQWERKGGPELLSAFRIVRERHPEAVLVIVGCAPNLSTEGVEVLGESSPDAVSEQFRRATVFCMPTRVEPFGLVFVEALTHGVPVVATAVGAVPDVVQNGETGCLVAPGDSVGLAQALDKMINDPLRCREFGELGQRRMAERYSWPMVVDAMSSAIRRAIG